MKLNLGHWRYWYTADCYLSVTDLPNMHELYPHVSTDRKRFRQHYLDFSVSLLNVLKSEFHISIRILTLTAHDVALTCTTSD